MPNYEFLCLECGARFEVFRRMDSANTPTNCSTCSSMNTKRQLSRIYISSSGNKAAHANSGGSGCGGCSRSSCSGCGK